MDFTNMSSKEIIDEQNKVNQAWKNRHNDTARLTLEQLINNTIQEEQKQVAIQQQAKQGFFLVDNVEGYYQAISILNEIL